MRKVGEGVFHGGAWRVPMSMGVPSNHQAYLLLGYMVIGLGLLKIAMFAYMVGVGVIFFVLQPVLARFVYEKPWAVDEFFNFRHGRYYDGSRVNSWRSFARAARK